MNIQWPDLFQQREVGKAPQLKREVATGLEHDVAQRHAAQLPVDDVERLLGPDEAAIEVLAHRPLDLIELQRHDLDALDQMRRGPIEADQIIEHPPEAGAKQVALLRKHARKPIAAIFTISEVPP